MDSVSNRIIQNVHIYFSDGFWYIPRVVKRPDGFWVEMGPAEKVARGDNQHLAETIDEARQASIVVSTFEKGWDGENGKIWDLAQFNCHIYWWSDGMVKMAPQLKTPEVIDSETGETRQGEWRAIKGDVLIFPSDTSIEALVAHLNSSVESLRDHENTSKK